MSRPENSKPFLLIFSCFLLSVMQGIFSIAHLLHSSSLTQIIGHWISIQMRTLPEKKNIFINIVLRLLSSDITYSHIAVLE